MIKPVFLFTATIAIALLCACKSNDGTPETTKKFIETSYMDSSVKPGDNFYLFVNGKWIKDKVIPATETSVGAFNDLYDRTKAHVKNILDSVSNVKAKNGTTEQQVGDFYASGMDSATVEKRGYDPIKPYLQRVAGFTNAQSIMQFETEICKSGENIIIGLGIGPDDKNSNMNIAFAGQTGLGLPDRDYYLTPNDAIQKAYQIYIQRAFVLTGDDSAVAAKKTAAVYALEKTMAQSHRTNVQLRDPQTNYNKTAVADLDKKEPTIGWSNYLNGLNVKVDSINIGQPGYYAELETLLKTTPVETWKAYYQFHIINDAAPYLSSAFVNARFDFYGKALSGQQQIKPRWERIYRATDNALGEALGHLYVDKYFTADAKKRMLELVNNLQTSLNERISKLDWMTDSTKGVAKDKLNAFLKKIGFPDKWRDYSKVIIDRNKYFENVVACNKNNTDYDLNKAGKPVDRKEWGMTPPTINAYYNPTFNEIVFPAGILQFPFFDPDADDAINYGGIGMVIGHEMTHGFDDQGSQYDKDGNLKNWWGAADKEHFDAKAKQVISLYNTFTVLDSLHVNGALTTGENMADIGGIAIAYNAFKMTKQGKDTAKIDGFTPDQRFFISFAQIWRDKAKDEAMSLQVKTDPHSPPTYRVNGPLENFTPFYQAFDVQEGNKMYKPESDRIKIW